MKKCILFFLLFTISTLIISCRYEQDKPQNVNFDSSNGTIELNFEELLSKFEVVQLETNEECLLSGNTKYCFTKDFIIAIDPHKIFKFDKKGNYISTLARKGNGPGEFGTVVNPIIIPNKEILYYIDFNEIGKIQSLDILNETSLTSVEPIPGFFSIHAADSEGFIYGISNTGININAKENDSLSLAFKYNPEIDSLYIFKGNKKFNASMFGNILYGNGEDFSLLNFNYSDTLFRIEKGRLKAKYIIELEKRISSTSNSGSELRLIYENRRGYVFHKFDSEIIKRENGSLERNLISSNYLFLDKSDGKLNIIESIYFKEFNQHVNIQKESVLNISPLPVSYGEYAYCKIDAIYAKLINKSFSNNENSNPLLLFGKINEE